MSEISISTPTFEDSGSGVSYDVHVIENNPAEMKLVFIHENEAWFWIFNDENGVWECWYEVGDTPATRLDKLDRIYVRRVTDTIGCMVLAAKNEENVYTYV